jgi:hypothetical protein
VIAAFYFYIRRLALAYWLGMMLFFSTLVVGTVFKVLPREQAVVLLGTLFPLYYKAGLACASIIALSIIVRARIRQRGLLWTPSPWETLTTSRRVALSLLAVFVLIVIFSFCLWIITPKIGELRSLMALAQDSETLGALRKDFDFFHQSATILNVVAIILLLILLGFF